MAKTTAMRNAVLDAILNATALTGAATIYMALHSGAPGADGSANELSGDGYARTAISFGAASDGEAVNDGAVTFPDPTGDWATATHFSIWSADTGGTCYYADALENPATAETGVPLVFPVGSVSMTET